MPVAVATKNLLNQYRPRYSSAERLIRSSEHESFYAPEALLPDEIDVNLYRDFILFTFRYTPQEPSSSKLVVSGTGTQLMVSKRTRKLHSIRVEFEKNNFDSLLENVDKCVAAIKKLKGGLEREVMQKSYEVVRQMVVDIKSRLIADEASIRAAFEREEAA